MPRLHASQGDGHVLQKYSQPRAVDPEIKLPRSNPISIHAMKGNGRDNAQSPMESDEDTFQMGEMPRSWDDIEGARRCAPHGRLARPGRASCRLAHHRCNSPALYWIVPSRAPLAYSQHSEPQLTQRVPPRCRGAAELLHAPDCRGVGAGEISPLQLVRSERGERSAQLSAGAPG